MIEILAIDDEPLALRQLAHYIEQIPYFHLAATCPCAKEAIKIINNQNIDAMFCDINMPDLSGMEFVKSLAMPPIVVFTTAYSEYAVEGYRVDAVDYLLKPYGLDDFKRAANKVKRRYDLLHPTAQTAMGQATNPTTTEDLATPNTIFLRTEHRVVKVDISNIRYIEGMSEYLKIHLDDRKSLVVLLSMKKLEERLPANFMRIHRSYIINLDRIQEVTKNRICMDANTCLPLGDIYREAFGKYLQSKFIGK